MTNKEKFLAGLPFNHHLLSADNAAKAFFKSDGTLSSIIGTNLISEWFGNIDKITPTRVFIYNYWLRKKLTAKFLFEDMNFDIELDKYGNIKTKKDEK